MNGRIHIILGTPHSDRRAILSQFVSKDLQSEIYHSLLPAELGSMSMSHSHWTWQQDKFDFDELPGSKEEEYFLFFSNEINLAEQFEAVLEILAQEEELSMGRVILFLNSDLLPDASHQIMAWIDAAGHFSDAICFTHRKNENAMAISKCMERFETLRYPLETYVIGSKKVGVLQKILITDPRRITHVFDPPDLLDEDDSPQDDPYLAKLANGKRERLVPPPF
jgi:hypothetical protein